MGHADIKTMMIYVHHVPQNDAADKLSKPRCGRVDAGFGTCSGRDCRRGGRAER